jgi:hypothetical protein
MEQRLYQHDMLGDSSAHRDPMFAVPVTLGGANGGRDQR